MIVRDGEGATKCVQIVIQEAASPAQAKKAFQAIASSVLFRSALFGANPNWDVSSPVSGTLKSGYAKAVSGYRRRTFIRKT